MACAAAVAPIGMLISLRLGIAPTIALGAIVAGAHLVFQINIGVLVVDIFPMRHVATVFGLIAAGSALGGFASTQLVGQLASTHAWGGIFLLMGMLHPLALLVAWSSLRGRNNEQQL